MDPIGVHFCHASKSLLRAAAAIGWRISKNNDFVRRTEGIKPSSRTIGAESHEKLGTNLC